MDFLREAVSSIRYFINHLLPFTTPGTPLVQDILHTLVLCSVLYYAPTFLERRTAEYLEQQREGIPQERQTNDASDDQEFVNGSPVEEPFPLDDFSDTENAINDEDPRVAHEPEQQEPFPRDIDANFAGPANPPPNQTNLRTRDVGKKKAASIARREQKRAYHEFLRSEGDAQRARDREIETALEDELFEEKRRRALIDQELEEKKKAERDEKREKERKSREKELLRRKTIIDVVRKRLEDTGFVELDDVVREVGDGIGAELVEKLVRAEGLLRQDISDGAVTMITSAGFIVRLTVEDMREAYRRAAVVDENDEVDDDEIVGWDTLSKSLEQVVRKKKGVS
ncbi:MAG: hypothetical protein M1812_002091 [Candelaria pacifica]|nr:MAG: hypothetical protein M1812_002091 [Candelaria pacifica]